MTRRRIRRRALVCLGALLWPGVVLGQEDERPPRATLTSEEIRQRLQDSAVRVRSWRIEYASAPRPDAQAGEVYIHRVVAAEAPGRFSHWTRKWTAGASPNDDPLQQRMILDSSWGVVEFPLSRAFTVLQIEPRGPLPGSAPQELLFTALGWWPFDDRPAMRSLAGCPIVFRDIATAPEYVVRAAQERVAGRWCHVLEWPGRDRLWLDCAKGAVLMIRELADPQSGEVLQLVQLSDHEEVKPGIWVPRRVRNVLNDPSRGSQAFPALDSLFEVRQVSVNDPLPVSTFLFEPRPGMLELSGSGVFEQTVPGGLDYLDDLVAWARRYAVRAAPTQTWGTVEMVIECGVVAVCSVTIITRVRRRSPLS